MDAAKRERIQAAGFGVGTVAEFLGLDEAESQAVELRVKLGTAVRRLRHQNQLTQGMVAKLLKTSQSRLATIELGIGSLDAVVTTFFVLGGTLDRLEELGSPLTDDEQVERVTARKAKGVKRSAAKRAVKA